MLKCTYNFKLHQISLFLQYSKILNVQKAKNPAFIASHNWITVSGILRMRSSHLRPRILLSVAGAGLFGCTAVPENIRWLLPYENKTIC